MDSVHSELKDYEEPLVSMPIYVRSHVRVCVCVLLCSSMCVWHSGGLGMVVFVCGNE